MQTATIRDALTTTEDAPTATAEPRVFTGSIDGAQYRVEVPAQWNGTVMLFAHHYRQPGLPCPALVVPSSDELGPRMDGETLKELLLARGFALGGTAKTTGWMMEDTLRDQVKLHDWFIRNVGVPKRSYVWGASPGGLAAITLAALHPRRFDGALSLCADASGVVNQMLLRLDMGHAINTLLVPGRDLELGLITDPETNFERANIAITEAAEGDPVAQARLILAAALGDITPPVDSWSAKVPGSVQEIVTHLSWIIPLAHGSITFGVARKEMEDRAGGNPIWNVGVDYRELFARSTMRDLVHRAYAEAGADLEADLAALNDAPRVSADEHATHYLVRTGGFPGLTPVPVVTMHTTLDGTTPVEHERSLADRVALVGTPENLRQLFVERALSCSVSPAEVMVALDLLDQRVGTGSWGDTSPDALNAAVAAYPEEHRKVYNFWVADLDRRWTSLPGAFTAFEPEPLPRSFPF